MTPDRADYNAMTTNERLYTAGLLEQFDVAAESRNRDAMIRILLQVDLSAEEAASIAEKILAAPGRYGH